MLLLSISLNAQILDPVSWKTSLEKLDNSTYYLVIRADIDPGWHLYSQKEYDDGPVSTNFSFSQTEDYELMGNTEESVPIEKYEETFKMNLQSEYFSAISRPLLSGDALSTTIISKLPLVSFFIELIQFSRKSFPL